MIEAVPKDRVPDEMREALAFYGAAELYDQFIGNGVDVDRWLDFTHSDDYARLVGRILYRTERAREDETAHYFMECVAIHFLWNGTVYSTALPAVLDLIKSLHLVVDGYLREGAN